MIKYKKEFYVGLFIILSILCSLILVLHISGTKIFYNKEYIINAKFKNIGTLKEKAKITIGGVKIGNVKNIKLEKNEENEYYPFVQMSINFNIKNIPKDSIANILMSSLLGDSYIQIEPGNDNEYFKDGDTMIFTTQALIIEDLIDKFVFNK